MLKGCHFDHLLLYSEKTFVPQCPEKHYMQDNYGYHSQFQDNQAFALLH